MPERYDPTDAGWHPENSVFGSAIDVYFTLSAEARTPADGTRRWYVRDHDALAVSMYFENTVRRHDWPPDAPTEVRTELDEALLRWHGALPFTEVERSVVADAYAAPSTWEQLREVPGQLRKQEFELVSGGLQTVVHGRDLMRRWWAWRRETDEFEGQGSLAQAREAAGDLAGRLREPDFRPDLFYDLRSGMAYEDAHGA